MTLLFSVNNQSLSLSPAQKDIKIIADSKNYLIARFVFQTPEWEECTPRYALFTYNGKTYKKYLGVEEGLKENECYVAPEVIKSGGFTVAVFGGDLITTHTVHIPVEGSGYTNNIVNQKNTPEAMEQMNTLLYKYASFCNEILKECQKIQKQVQEGREE